MKKLIIFTLASMLFVLSGMFCIAQGIDSSSVDAGTFISMIPDPVMQVLGYLFLAYEFLALVVPTLKNYSVLSKVMLFLDWIKKGGVRKVS